LENYDRRVAERLLEIESTPTGRPLVAWVRRHQPRIVLGRPLTGGGFTYPWPLSRIVISPHGDDDWLRGALVHELTHLIRYGGPGSLFASVEQERVCAWTTARVWTEYPPNDPTPAAMRHNYHEQAGWVLDQPPEAARRTIRTTWGQFYRRLPELQPGPWPWQQLAGGWRQIIDGVRLLFGR